MSIDLLIGAIGDLDVRGWRAAAAADWRAGRSSGDDDVEGAGVGCRRLKGVQSGRGRYNGHCQSKMSNI